MGEERKAREENRIMVFRSFLKLLLISGFWILVWHVLAKIIDNDLLLVTPWEALKVMVGFVDSLQFWQTICMSLLRILLGLFAGVTLGVLLGAFSFRFRFVEELVSPLMNLLKTVPVVSFVVLLLIWWGAGFLSVCICFLIVFPNIYIGVLEGLKNTPGELREMAKVFGLSPATAFAYIYRPAMKPFLYSSLYLALGMCWKSGVAAEVIGTPAFSIGEKLYLAKIYLDTGGLFAWTAVIILLSVLFEKICMYLTEILFTEEPGIRKCRGGEQHEGEVTCENLDKAFEGRPVLKQVKLCCKPGETQYLTWPSGAGKTTLLRILAGLEKADGGTVKTPGTCAMVFQEDRLCPEYSAIRNVEMVTADPLRSREALLKLLEPEELLKPCSQLSGGQKRRVAIVRAMEAEADYILLDEPFTGMDQMTIERVKNYIAERQGNRPIIIATHI